MCLHLCVCVCLWESERMMQRNRIRENTKFQILILCKSLYMTSNSATLKKNTYHKNFYTILYSLSGVKTRWLSTWSLVTEICFKFLALPPHIWVNFSKLYHSIGKKRWRSKNIHISGLLWIPWHLDYDLGSDLC